MPRFAVSLNMLFNEWPLLERFAAASEAGFRAVEVQFPYAEPPAAIAAAMSRHDQQLLLINTPRGPLEHGDRGLAALKGQQTAFRELFKQTLTYADATGAQMIHVMAGRGPDADEATFVAALRWAVEQVARRPITLLIEPLNQIDNPGYFLSDFALAASIIERVASSKLRLQYDIYHRQLLHGDIINSLTRLLPIIGHVQFAGVPGRHEPLDGEINFDAIFASLDRLGYAGWVAAEYRPRNGTLAGLGWHQHWLAAP